MRVPCVVCRKAKKKNASPCADEREMGAEESKRKTTVLSRISKSSSAEEKKE